MEEKKRKGGLGKKIGIENTKLREWEEGKGGRKEKRKE